MPRVSPGKGGLLFSAEGSQPQLDCQRLHGRFPHKVQPVLPPTCALRLRHARHRPIRTAHQEAATAMAKERGAVDSASSWDGKCLFPCTVVGVAGTVTYIWLLPTHTLHSGSLTTVPNATSLALAAAHQWRDRHGFSRTEAPPRSAWACSWDNTQLQAWLSVCTQVGALPETLLSGVARSRSAVRKFARYLTSSRLGTAVQCCRHEVNFLQLLCQRRLPMGVR